MSRSSGRSSSTVVKRCRFCAAASAVCSAPTLSADAVARPGPQELNGRITGMDAQGTLLRASRAGAFACLREPLDSNALLVVLAQARAVGACAV